MALDAVKYRVRDKVFEVPGKGRFEQAQSESLVLPVALLRSTSATSLRNALVACREAKEFPSGIYFSTVPWDEFDPNSSQREDIDLVMDPFDATLAIDAYFYLEPDQRFEEARWQTLVEPLLEQHGATFEGCWTDDDYGTGLVVAVVARPALRGRSVGDLFELGNQLDQLLSVATKAAELTALSAVQLVRGRQATTLLGQPENQWIDAKATPYRVGTSLEKQELAKDVAAFANGGQEAVIILGMKTERSVNGDVIESARPFPIAAMDVEAIAAVLRDWVVPPILDLEVEAVESQDGLGYGLIRIPSQDPALLPLVVAGGELADQFVGSQVTIPFRAGQDTVYADPARVHSLLAAGRASLAPQPAQS